MLDDVIEKFTTRYVLHHHKDIGRRADHLIAKNDEKKETKQETKTLLKAERLNLQRWHLARTKVPGGNISAKRNSTLHRHPVSVLMVFRQYHRNKSAAGMSCTDPVQLKRRVNKRARVRCQPLPVTKLLTTAQEKSFASVQALEIWLSDYWANQSVPSPLRSLGLLLVSLNPFEEILWGPYKPVQC